LKKAVDLEKKRENRKQASKLSKKTERKESLKKKNVMRGFAKVGGKARNSLRSQKGGLRWGRGKT